MIEYVDCNIAKERLQPNTGAIGRKMPDKARYVVPVSTRLLMICNMFA